VAPELSQISSEPSDYIDWGKLDCFALGVVLAKIAARETSVIREKQELLQIMKKIDEVYSRRLVVIIKRLTASDPGERWSAERLFKSLQEEYMLQNITETDFDELLSEEQRDIQEAIEKGLAYRKSEDYFLALEVFEKAKNALMRTPSMNQYDRTLCANCLYNIAGTYYEIKDYSKSIANHLLCLDLKKKYLGGLDSFTSYGNIGKAYTKLGHPQKGLMYYLKAYTTSKKFKGDMKLPNMAKSLDNIACTYESIGDYQSALENHLVCLEMVKKLHGETNSRYAKTLRNISRTLKILGRFEDSRTFELKAKKINY
jgi:tetratricopeptide (TPR) repeat protein